MAINLLSETNKATSLGLSNLALQFLIGSVGLLCVRSIYTAFFGPLSSIPGPEITRWTDLYTRLTIVRGSQAAYIHSLHQRYGPIVRTGPNTVDISDGDSVREIHNGKGGFLKTSFYGPRQSQSMFSTRDPDFHRLRRRQLGQYFSENTIASLEPVAYDLVQTAIAGMAKESARSGCVDVLKWWTLVAMDIIGELSTGESFGLTKSGKKTQYAEDVARLGSILPYRTAFPVMLWVGSYLPIPSLRNIVQSRQRIMTYSMSRLSRSMELNKSSSQEEKKKTLLASLINADSSTLTPMELMIEIQSYITAGTDTTAVTLTYLIWAVCRNPEIRSKLAQEVQAASASVGISHKTIRNLSYLNNVVDEALRCYSAAPGPLPRHVPSEGATLAGYFILGGTEVTTQSFTLHRDPSVMNNPDTFDPSRWENPTKAMKDAFMPFGIGPRGCIGVHLAKMELRLGAALFFLAYPNARVSEKYGMSDDDMNQHVSFLLTPKGHRCLLEV